MLTDTAARLLHFSTTGTSQIGPATGNRPQVLAPRAESTNGHQREAEGSNRKVELVVMPSNPKRAMAEAVGRIPGSFVLLAV